MAALPTDIPDGERLSAWTLQLRTAAAAAAAPPCRRVC